MILDVYICALADWRTLAFVNGPCQLWASYVLLLAILIEPDWITSNVVLPHFEKLFLRIKKYE